MRPAPEAFEGQAAGEGVEVLAGKILQMLELRASEAVPAWLAGKLTSLYRPSRARVLRVLPGAAARNRTAPPYAVFAMDAGDGPAAPHLVAIDAVLIDAIREGRAWRLVRTEGGARLLVTLAVGGEVRFVVELVGAFDAAHDARLAAFSAMASRFFERLVDAETDPLTHLFNRRAFHGQLESCLRRDAAGAQARHFAVLDIDHFKRINDEYGHLYGDEILVRFARLMRETFRCGDQLYRFGGEEFVVLYGVERDEEAAMPLERFRAAVEAHRFPGVGTVTVSAGHTRIPHGTTPASTLMDRADLALYYAKSHGRNQVRSWDCLKEAGELETPAANRDVTLF